MEDDRQVIMGWAAKVSGLLTVLGSIFMIQDIVNDRFQFI